MSKSNSTYHPHGKQQRAKHAVCGKMFLAKQIEQRKDKDSGQFHKKPTELRRKKKDGEWRCGRKSAIRNLDNTTSGEDKQCNKCRYKCNCWVVGFKQFEEHFQRRKERKERKYILFVVCGNLSK